MLKSESKSQYFVHPHKIEFFYGKLGQFLDNFKALPGKQAYAYEMNALKVNAEERDLAFSFMEHLEDIGMIT